MIRGLSVLAFTAMTIHAQQLAFQALAPNGDGSVLYFSCPLRLKNSSDQYPHPKIFQWTTGRGVQLFAQRAPEYSVFPPRSWGSGAHRLESVSISSDETVMALTAVSDCSFGTPCAVSIDRYFAELRLPGRPPETFAGRTSLSPNGRYLLIGSAIAFPIFPPPPKIRDLQTGTERTVAAASFEFVRHSVSNHGAAAKERVPEAHTARIDAAGRRVFYVPHSTPEEGHTLVLLDTLTNATRNLAMWSRFAGQSPAFDISDDGMVFAYADGNGEAWIVRTESGLRMQVPPAGDPIREVAMSGDGTKVFVLTAASQILRVDTRNLFRDVVVPATRLAQALFAQSDSEVLTPGGMMQFSAQSLPQITGVRLLQRELKVLPATANQIIVEAPYDMPEGIGLMEFALAPVTETPFAEALIWFRPTEVRNYQPVWCLADGTIAALHQDFSGPVTRESPARAGEIVHVYGKGFGPVSPVPQNGEPASANPLSYVVAPVACELGTVTGGKPAQVLFAGLAPGYVGLYQVDVRIPEVTSGAESLLRCGHAPLVETGISWGTLPVAPAQ